MIDRHYGHLARDGREQPSNSSTLTTPGRWTLVDARWTWMTPPNTHS
jgi:hypothetical protein